MISISHAGLLKRPSRGSGRQQVDIKAASARCASPCFFLIMSVSCAAVVLCDSADGYISNTCVDIDYEAVKRTLLQRRIEPLQLPPPPPDPPQMSIMESYTRDR